MMIVEDKEIPYVDPRLINVLNKIYDRDDVLRRAFNCCADAKMIVGFQLGVQNVIQFLEGTARNQRGED